MNDDELWVQMSKIFPFNNSYFFHCEKFSISFIFYLLLFCSKVIFLSLYQHLRVNSLSLAHSSIHAITEPEVLALMNSHSHIHTLSHALTSTNTYAIRVTPAHLWHPKMFKSTSIAKSSFFPQKDIFSASKVFHYDFFLKIIFPMQKSSTNKSQKVK